MTIEEIFRNTVLILFVLQVCIVQFSTAPQTPITPTSSQTPSSMFAQNNVPTKEQTELMLQRNEFSLTSRGIDYYHVPIPCRHKLSGAPVVKKVAKKDKKDEGSFDLLTSEFNALVDLDCYYNDDAIKRGLPVVYSFRDGELVLSRTGSNLRKIKRDFKTEPYTLETVLCYMAKTLRKLEYMHERKFVHGFIRPTTITKGFVAEKYISKSTKNPIHLTSQSEMFLNELRHARDMAKQPMPEKRRREELTYASLRYHNNQQILPASDIFELMLSFIFMLIEDEPYWNTMPHGRFLTNHEIEVLEQSCRQSKETIDFERLFAKMLIDEASRDKAIRVFSEFNEKLKEMPLDYTPSFYDDLEFILLGQVCNQPKRNSQMLRRAKNTVSLGSSSLAATVQNLQIQEAEPQEITWPGVTDFVKPCCDPQ